MIKSLPLAHLRFRSAEWQTIVILLLIYTLAYLDRQILTLLVDPIRMHLAVSDVEMGFLQGIGFTLFYALCGPFVGWMVDRHNRRMIIFSGVVFWTLSTAACGFANSYMELLLARFGVGAGEAALLPAAYSIISDMVDKSRLGRAMGIFSLGSIAGASLSYVVGGALITYLGQYAGTDLPLIGTMRDWQLVFIAIGALGIPMSFMAFAFPDPGRGTRGVMKSSAPANTWSHFLRHWRFYACHFSAFSLFCFLGASTTAWSATYLMREFTVSVSTVSALLGIKTLTAGAFGIVGAGLLADWLTRRGYQDAHLRMYIYIMPIFTAAGLMAFLSTNLWIAFAGLALIGLIAPFIAVAAAALQLATVPDRRGIASASFLLVYNLVGFGLGPAIVALVSREIMGADGNLGRGLAFAFVIIPPIIMLLMAFGLRPMREAVAEVANSGPRHIS